MGYPQRLSLCPHTSTPLGQAPINLNKSPAQIWCPFWASSSRLGVSAPALSALLSFGSRDALLFSLDFSFLYLGADGATGTLSSVNGCSFVGAASPPLCRLQGRENQDGRALGHRLSGREFTLGICFSHSGSIFLALKAIAFNSRLLLLIIK